MVTWLPSFAPEISFHFFIKLACLCPSPHLASLIVLRTSARTGDSARSKFIEWVIFFEIFFFRDHILNFKIFLYIRLVYNICKKLFEGFSQHFLAISSKIVNIFTNILPPRSVYMWVLPTPSTRHRIKIKIRKWFVKKKGGGGDEPETGLSLSTSAKCHLS